MNDFFDLIIVIPGILGSRLEREDGTLLYDLTLAGLPRTLWNLTDNDQIYRAGDKPPDDGVIAKELFNLQLLPGFFGNDNYGELVEMLRRSVPHPDKQVITFPYDWRASNRWSAEKLNELACNALTAWRKEINSKEKEPKLWLICHSMGGLVARYFCEHLGGAEITRELITLSTPHRGAAKALYLLVKGMQIARVIDVSAFVRSLPSVYELLPQFPVLRETNSGAGKAFRLCDAYGLGDRLPVPNCVNQSDWGAVPSNWRNLPNLKRDMLESALRFHAAIRDPVIKRMNGNQPAPYSIRCFLNRRQPTILSAKLHQGLLEASEGDPFAKQGETPDPANRGDGTVAAFSAIPIEWNNTSAAIAVAARHVGMPSSREVLDVLRNWIRPQDARAYMGAGDEDQAVLGLKAPEAIRQGEPLVVELDALQIANVAVTLSQVGSPETVMHPIRARVPGNGEPLSLDLGTPPEGTWQLTIQPQDRRRPAVSDYVLVLGGG